MKRKNIIVALLEIIGVVVLRFRLIPRVWGIWLVAVNLCALYFITHIEAQVLLAITLCALLGQALMYRRVGFVRLLGIVHVAWLPMFAWIATRWEHIAMFEDLANWIILLAATNAISLVVDGIDALRYAKGERKPHYSWVKPSASVAI